MTTGETGGESTCIVSSLHLASNWVLLGKIRQMSLLVKRSIGDVWAVSALSVVGCGVQERLGRDWRNGRD